VHLEGSPYTIVGVLPPIELALPDSGAIDLFVPLVISAERLQSVFGDFDYIVLGRLKPGVSLAQARAQLDAIESDIVTQHAKEAEGSHLRAYVMPLKESVIGHIRSSLWLLLAAVGCVLLIVCINVANLQLARGVLRERETALRCALGAGRADLLWHVVAESVLLALAGGWLGVGLCWAMLRVVPHVLPVGLPRSGSIHLDGTVLGFSLLVTVLSVLLAGVFPAWRSMAVDPQTVLQRDSGRATGSRRHARLRQTLVAVEVLASTALLLVTILIAKSLVRLLTIDRGFQTQHILTLQLDLPYATYKKDEDISAFYDRALAALKQLPGVGSAGFSSVPLLHGATWIDGLRAVPANPNPHQQTPMANMRWVSPDYLPAIGTRLVAGRMLGEEDRGKDNALLSESAARTLWPGENGVGRTFTDGTEKVYTVAGVIADARSEQLSSEPTLIVYLPYWDNPQLGAFFTIRTTTDPTALASSVRVALAQLEPEAAITNVQTMDEVVSASLAQRRFEFAVLISFAGAALLLAALGLYGVLSYTVAERTQEMGVRIALGAPKWSLYLLVFRQAAIPVLAGLAGGLATSWVGARFIGSLLFQVTPYDLPSVLMVATALAGIALLACYRPARRAASIEPMQALRTE
jgi:predicted permease